MAREFLPEEHNGLLSYLEEGIKSNRVNELFGFIRDYVQKNEEKNIYNKVVIPLGRIDNAPDRLIREIKTYLDEHISNKYDINLSPKAFNLNEGLIKSEGELIIYLKDKLSGYPRENIHNLFEQ